MLTFNRRSALFLKMVIVFIGIGTLAFLFLEPLHEGRNVNATLFQVYFNDGFLAYVYIASIAFFVALYNAFTLIGYIGNNKASSEHSVKALRTIRYCSLALVVCIVGAEAYLVIVQRKIEEDIAGGVAMGLFAMLISVVMGAVTAVLEQLVRRQSCVHAACGT